MERRQPLIIAIDGPSGAGKGTVARTIAAKLSYQHVDTGAMYRAVAWKALRAGLDLADDEGVAAVAASAEFTLGARILIDGADVTDAIRTPEIDRAAALVARLPQVRSTLVARQRQYGNGGGVVMEGRDIGTTVFPAADVKVYLDASPEERARRRSQDPSHAASREGGPAVAAALEARDASDRTRDASPLTLADGAAYIDTTGMPIDEVVGQVLALVRQATPAR